LEPGNRLVLAGTLTARDALRYTPAGVPIVSFQVAHASMQVEAGAAREVAMELACVAVEVLARLVAAAPLGAGVLTAGFLARKGKTGRQMVLHVTELEFTQVTQATQDTQDKEGDRNAPSQQRT
jgi:primosomal replication protein N